MSLKIKVKDEVKVIDNLDIWKKWPFRGLRHFFTVRILPPRK